MSDVLLHDPVPRSAEESRQIGFDMPERYNASEILFANLDRDLGEKIAVYCDAGNATYRELCEEASRFGNALLAIGLERGSRVSLVLSDTRAYPAAVFGAIRAGMVPVLINTASPPDLVEYFVADSGSPVLVIQGELTGLLADGFESRLPVLEHLVVVDGESVATRRVGAVRYDELLGPHAGELRAADTGRDDMAFWMYSSGSTGRPKGIVHLQHDMRYTHLSYARHVLGIDERDICFSPPKIFFAYGFGNSVTFPFSAGASVVLLPGRPSPQAVFDAVSRYRPTLFFGLPTLYNALINSPQVDEARFDSVRLCLSAAETLSAELADRWRVRFGHDIVEGLGSTEVLHIYLSNTAHQQRSGSAGRRVPGYRLRLVAEDGEEAADGEPGILWVRGDSQSPGYWNKPDKTAETMRDDWICTGDRFKRDSDGFYYFLGRADDLVKVSGQWVYPMEVELCLQNHEAVRECAVLAVKLDDGRMTLKACVTLVAGETGDEEMTRRLKDYVKTTLLPHKYPRSIEYLPQLPKTGTGKIDRQALLG